MPVDCIIFSNNINMSNKFKQIPIEQLELNEGQVEWLPRNPRQWTREQLDKLKASILETPLLLEARGLLVWAQTEASYVVIGGNMRLAALRELNAATAPCYVLPAGFSPEKVKEIAIKDNGSFGEWDMDALMADWQEFNPEEFWTGADRWSPADAAGQEGGSPGIPQEALPPELQGVEMDPDKQESIVGDDETAMERVIITFKGDEVEAVERLLGVKDVTSRVVWRLEDIIEAREEEE